MLEPTGLNKLEGLEPIYVINMEKSKDRKEYIVEHFNKYNISNYSFIDAIDAENTDLNNFVHRLDLLPLSKGEVATSLSHLKAIEHWLNTSESEYAIIVEDDVSFETSEYWNFSWKDFFESVTQKYDILQLAIINNFVINPRLHLREFLDWSAAVYLIKRPYAERLIKKHKSENMYILSNTRYSSISEGVIFSKSLCYSIPLFTYSIDLGSSLNEDHVQTVHKSSRNQTLSYWRKNSIFKPDLV